MELISKNGRKTLRWLNKRYPNWFHWYEIQNGAGAFVEDVLLTELYKRGFLQRELFPWDADGTAGAYDPVPYSYLISDFGRAYLEALPGYWLDRWLTRLLAFWGAVTGTIAVVDKFDLISGYIQQLIK